MELSNFPEIVEEEAALPPVLLHADVAHIRGGDHFTPTRKKFPFRMDRIRLESSDWRVYMEHF